MRILAEADATVEEKERAFRQWLDEHPNATIMQTSSRQIFGYAYDTGHSLAVAEDKAT